MSKDIKSAQPKLDYAVRECVLKELDLCLPRKVNVNFLVQVEQQIRAAFGRVPTGLNLVSVHGFISIDPQKKLRVPQCRKAGTHGFVSEIGKIPMSEFIGKRSESFRFSESFPIIGKFPIM